MSIQWKKTPIVLGTLLATSTLFSGCSLIIKTGANVALSFTQNHIVPPILKQTDTDMACVSSTALTPVLQATQDMGADPTRVAVITLIGASLCSEKQAMEQELTYLRASKSGQVELAQDARIAQKRLAEISARRQYAAYQMFSETYERQYKVKLGEEGKCPQMRTDLDQTVYLLGMVSGVQAITNDVASGGGLNVPKDIAGIVERGMNCLNNEKFWGVPSTVRAAIWTLLPGAGDGKPDPFQTMKEGATLGEAKGVRLAHAIYAIAAQSTGKEEIIRDAIRTYGKTEGKIAVNKDYALLDAMGGSIVLQVSDRYWTEKTGARTPSGGMAQFWDDKPVDDSGVNVDDILN